MVTVRRADHGAAERRERPRGRHDTSRRVGDPPDLFREMDVP